MRTDPTPVTITAAMLAQRRAALPGYYVDWLPYEVAVLATDLHRLAPACHRHAEHECNGYQHERQDPAAAAVAIETSDKRLDRRIDTINDRLAALDVKAHRTGDPRGYTLHLTAVEGAPALPTNGMQGTWGIA